MADIEQLVDAIIAHGYRPSLLVVSPHVVAYGFSGGDINKYPGGYMEVQLDKSDSYVVYETQIANYNNNLNVTTRYLSRDELVKILIAPSIHRKDIIINALQQILAELAPTLSRDTSIQDIADMMDDGDDIFSGGNRRWLVR